MSDLPETRAAREELYKHFHRSPELSLQEYETAAKIRSELEAGGIEVITIGETGLVGVISNGEGPVVAMRGDIDALPMAEQSGKDYAATGVTQVDRNTGEETPVAHTCGHDVHISALLGAAQALQAHRDAWSGTFLAVFQPGEENAAGARDMVANGIVDKLPTPDVYLGQHVLGTLPGGRWAPGPGRCSPRRHPSRSPSTAKARTDPCQNWGWIPSCWARLSSPACRASCPGRSPPGRPRWSPWAASTPAPSPTSSRRQRCCSEHPGL